MMKIAYYNDGKGKFQSHEISVLKDDEYDNVSGCFDHYLHEIIGYGCTKEEAFEDFKIKFKHVLDMWNELGETLLKKNIEEFDIVETDWFRKALNDNNT